MKSLYSITVLFCTVNILLFAQNNNVKNKTSDKKKNNIVRDLNTLEAENIKAISLNKYNIKDTVRMLKDIDSCRHNTQIQNQFCNDSIQSQSKVLQDSSCIKNPLHSTFPKIKNNISSNDSLLTISFQNAYKTADSIHNANKYWLDSVMAALPKKKTVIINADDEIEIYVSGGGLYGGVNPKIYDVLKLYSSGLVHRDYKTKLQGQQTEERIIEKEEIRKLAQYIISMGFFDFNKIYDCNKKDGDCITRLKSKPEPIPLTISVRIGERRMRTYVTLFAPNMESNWVSYPVAIEKILDAIYNVASK